MGLDHGISCKLSLPCFSTGNEWLEKEKELGLKIIDVLGLEECSDGFGFVKVTVDVITLRKAYHISDYMGEVTDIGEAYEATFNEDALEGLEELCSEGTENYDDDDEWYQFQNEICLKGIKKVRSILEKYEMSELVYWQSY
jgi:hypothetical protein